MSPTEVAGRRRGREAALQMLYQAEVGKTDLDSVIVYAESAEVAEDAEAEGGAEDTEPGGTKAGLAEAEDPEAPRRLPPALREFANALARGTRERMPEIDRLLDAHAQNWRLERMAVIDRLVLRLAVYELLARPETPARVVINEAIELARTFSTEESVGFVNGILDAVRKDVQR